MTEAERAGLTFCTDRAVFHRSVVYSRQFVVAAAGAAELMIRAEAVTG